MANPATPPRPHAFKRSGPQSKRLGDAPREVGEIRITIGGTHVAGSLLGLMGGCVGCHAATKAKRGCGVSRRIGTSRGITGAMSARSPGSCSLTRSRRICTRRGGRTTLVARTLRRRPPSNSRGSRGHRTRRMDSWLAVLCELHKRNLLSGAPSDAEHVQGVESDTPIVLGTPSGGMAQSVAYVSGHYTSSRPLP